MVDLVLSHAQTQDTNALEKGNKDNHSLALLPHIKSTWAIVTIEDTYLA